VIFENGAITSHFAFACSGFPSRWSLVAALFQLPILGRSAKWRIVNVVSRFSRQASSNLAPLRMSAMAASCFGARGVGNNDPPGSCRERPQPV